jgi:hypothetical protein
MALRAPIADTICNGGSYRRLLHHAGRPRRAACLCIVLLLAAACEFNPAPSPTTAPTLIPPPTATTAPTAAPTALPALAVSAQPLDTVVRLSWPAVAGARSYNIFRDLGATPVNTSPVAETTYDDIGLTNGHAYHYGVAALDPNGNVLTRSAELTVAPKAP